MGKEVIVSQRKVIKSLWIPRGRYPARDEILDLDDTGTSQIKDRSLSVIHSDTVNSITESGGLVGRYESKRHHRDPETSGDLGRVNFHSFG